MLKDRIDRIIDIKSRQMDDKEREIEAERTHLSALAAEIDATDNDIEKNYNKMTDTGLKGSDFSVINDYLEYLENTKNMLIHEKASTEEKIVILRDEMVDLMKEMKMLETLKTKVVNELKKAANRREQKLLDDIALRIEDKKH